MTRLIALSGGIGSGKSVVSRILRTLGYRVYDTDSCARRIMDTDTQMLSHIYAEVCEEARRVDGTLNRQTLAACVFSDSARLARLNSIVHSAVRADLLNQARNQGGGVMFFETAILYSSGFSTLASQVWEVTAPENLRLARIISRSGISPADAQSRIDAQRKSEVPPAGITPHIIINDGIAPLLPQIEALVNLL